MSRPADWVAAARQDPTWILLPLRGYLGVAFLYAGVTKIGQREFLDASSPASMHATLVAVKGQSPIGGLLGPVVDHSFAFGVLMALGEVAVGVGVLLGLFARVAAAGGIVLALSLFLTVSWNADPWYTGADIVYVFALTPILLAGAGPLSLDAWLAARARAEAPDTAGDRTRRAVVGGLAGIAGLLAVGIAGLVRRSNGATTATGAQSAGGQPSSPASTPTSGSTSSTARSSPSAGNADVLVAAGSVPVGGAVPATDPKTGNAVYVLQLEKGSYTAVERRCPHQGCPVSFVSRSAGFTCPCHRSAFDATGKVTRGPATSGLTTIAVAEQGGKIVRS